MKTTMKTMLAVLGLGASALVATAQDTDTTTSEKPGKGHRPPPNPIVQALDVNHDGVIDADEIANAPAALKTLDKNGDGKLTFDELRPKGALPPRDGSTDDRPPGPPPGDE